MKYNDLSEQVYRHVYKGSLRTWANGGGEWTFPDRPKMNRPLSGPGGNTDQALALLHEVRAGRNFAIIWQDGYYMCGIGDGLRREGDTLAEAICRAVLADSQSEGGVTPDVAMATDPTPAHVDAPGRRVVEPRREGGAQ